MMVVTMTTIQGFNNYEDTQGCLIHYKDTQGCPIHFRKVPDITILSRLNLTLSIHFVNFIAIDAKHGLKYWYL